MYPQASPTWWALIQSTRASAGCGSTVFSDGGGCGVCDTIRLLERGAKGTESPLQRDEALETITIPATAHLNHELSDDLSTELAAVVSVPANGSVDLPLLITTTASTEGVIDFISHEKVMTENQHFS